MADKNMTSGPTESPGFLRDRLAADRTVLANERTLLAYVRTGLAFAVVGASCFKVVPSGIWWCVGLIAILIGVAIVSFGAWRAKVVQGRIRKAWPEDEGPTGVSSSLEGED